MEFLEENLSLIMIVYKSAQNLVSVTVFLSENAAAAAKWLQSRLTLCDPMDGSPPGSPVPGILQARTLECVAISFSNAWKWKVKVKSLSRVWLLVTPWTAAHQAPPSLGFPGKRMGVGCHCLLHSKNEASPKNINSPHLSGHPTWEREKKLKIMDSNILSSDFTCNPQHWILRSSQDVRCDRFFVQSLSRIWLFVIPWTAACQAALSSTISQSFFKRFDRSLLS